MASNAPDAAAATSGEESHVPRSSVGNSAGKCDAKPFFKVPACTTKGCLREPHTEQQGWRTRVENAWKAASRTRRSASKHSFGNWYDQKGSTDFSTSLDRVGNAACSSESAFTLVVQSFLFSRRKDTLSSLSSPLYVGAVWTAEGGAGMFAATGASMAAYDAANAPNPMKPLVLRGQTGRILGGHKRQTRR